MDSASMVLSQLRQQQREEQMEFAAKLKVLTQPMWSQYATLSCTSKKRRTEYVNTYKHAWLRAKQNGTDKEMLSLLKAAYDEVRRALL